MNVFNKRLRKGKSLINNISGTLVHQLMKAKNKPMGQSTNIKQKVCLFVLYSRPHCWPDCGQTWREGGHQAGIGFSDQMHQPICQIFAKKSRFFGQNSHCLVVAKWLSGVERSQAIFESSNIGTG